MTSRRFAPAVLTAGFLLALAGSALAQDTPEPVPVDAAEAEDAPMPAETPATAKEPQLKLGEKEYTERINIVARRPLRHDIEWVDSRDRDGWRDFTMWQGIRDKRPMIARKTLGFHVPDPHRTRHERVMMLSRGPLQGPAPSE